MSIARRIAAGIVVLAAAVAWPLAPADRPGAARAAAPDADAARHFDAQIAPLLARHCVECHGPEKKKGRLDLSRKGAALAGGKSGKAIVPGKSAESLLWKSVESDEMPEDRPPLSPREKDLLRQWIDAGAAWSDDEDAPLAHFTHRDGGGAAVDTWVRRLTVPEYIETVRSATGVDVAEDARRLLPRDVRADGFSNTAYNLTVDLAHVEAYAKLAEIVAGRMDVVKLAAEHSPSRELNDDNMRRVIAGMGKWLLRGPLAEHEVAAFLAVSNAVAKEGGDFAEAVRYVAEAMLQSPRFVYRVESGPGPYALASRMSYILWGGPPDKELMRAADAGELADRGRVEAQVQRMLQDPRAVERSSRFVHEWLDLDRLANLRPDKQRFPHWNEQLAGDMRDETLAFFRHVAWEQNRPLSELLNAKVTFATPRLADHYGLGRNVEIAAGLVATPPPRGPERVTSGLRALYTFEEGRGEMVRDVSGSADATHLKIAGPSVVRWGGDGLTVHASTLIAAERPPVGFIDAVRASGAVTIEAWLTPANTTQSGPARIVTLSDGVLTRNFTLGQDGDKFDVRFRSTTTNPSGQPSLPGPAGSLQTRRTHVVYTRDASGKARLYLDGEEKAARDVPGDLSNWDRGFTFALANETSRDRTWLGTYHLVALYDRALSAEEVRRNRDAGARGDGSPVAPVAAAAEHRRDGLQALYNFDERGGDAVRDTSGAGEPLDLKIENPAVVSWGDGGLMVNGPTLIAAAAPPRRLIDAVKQSKAITIEAWVAPADVGQSGPARIVTLSSGISQRNFTLGQDGDKFDVRLRTTRADGNGLPSLPGPGGSAGTALTHVVYTRDADGKARLYVNGEQKAARDVGGDLSNWDGNFRLALANETTHDRPWRGTYRRVAIYSRALTADEVRSIGRTPPRPQVIARYDLSSVPGGRGGLLTQGSALTVGGDDASMVTRGLFVLRDVLNGKVEDPPPCVDTTPVPPKPGQSQRAIAMQRLANASCGGCHSKFEPLAFGLERFDGIGAYHERDEHGNALREDGEILFPGSDQPVKYDSSAQLMDLLAGSEQVRKVITRKVTQFAIGRPLAEADGPALDKIHESARANGGTYASVITAVVMSDLVQKPGSETGSETGTEKSP